MTLADVLGVLGFILAVTLGGVELWTLFFQKSKLVVEIERAYRENQSVGLSVVVLNVGRKKDVVRDVYVRFPEDPTMEHGHGDPRVHDALPIALDANEATPRLLLGTPEILKALREGRVEHVVVKDAQGHHHTFDLPPELDVDDPTFEPRL